MLDALLGGLAWWQVVFFILATTHITIVAVTLYLHRHQAHRALDLHPIVSHFFRFWLWLTTGMITREWVAIHRKHHATTETREDPHSPAIYGIWRVLFQGAELYRAATRQSEIMVKYGHGTPDDWLEKKLYSRHPYAGITLLFALYVLLFGPFGITLWAVQMIWIPFFAAGVINGGGHFWGYRNFESPDRSTNLVNVGILIGGEEMHNNHHAYPSSAKFSIRWWEFDIGWLYIRLLVFLGLAKVKKIAPRPIINLEKNHIDTDTIRAMVVSRLHLMAEYARQVTVPVLKAELAAADSRYQRLLRQVKGALVWEESRLSAEQITRLQEVLQRHVDLKVVYEFRHKLQALWAKKHLTHESLLRATLEWCQEAERTGVSVLEEFAQNLRGYTLKPGLQRIS